MKNFYLFGILSIFCATPLLRGADKPNIIIVLADDQGYGDFSANNPESKIPTPNLDRIAAEGMRFTDAHTSSGVCTPSRYSLLTGRYHWRTLLQNGVLGGFSRPLIAPDRLTVAGMLRDQGYTTACFGKWHLGMDWSLKGGGIADDRGIFAKPFSELGRVDYSIPIQNGPLERGFDTYYGISASLDMYPYVWIHDRLATEAGTETKAFPRPGPAGRQFEAIDVQTGITDHTIAYIGEKAAASKEGKPFFTYIPLAAPHTPIVPAEKWQGTSGINPYADFVRQVDSDVGRILDALKENGIAENTIVIFTADNGCSPSANLPELQKAGHSPSYIFRGHKADLYEGGHRVPFVVRWPGKVKAGTTSDQLIGQIDFLATFAELVGAEIPAAAGEDSVSFLPVLLGTADKAIRTSIISQSINGNFAIRDGQWKLALCPGSGGWSFPKPGMDDTTGQPDVQLYQLEKDPGEKNNLAAEYPDRVVTMTAALEKAISEGRTTPGPEAENDVAIVMIKPTPPAKKKGKAK